MQPCRGCDPGSNPGRGANESSVRVISIQSLVGPIALLIELSERELSVLFFFTFIMNANAILSENASDLLESLSRMLFKLVLPRCNPSLERA